MHNLFLGELRHHCMEVWGIDIKDKPPSGKKTQPHTQEEQRKWIAKGLLALRKQSRNALEKLRKGYVVAFANLNDVAPVGGKFTKAAYILGLVAWVRLLSSTRTLPPVLDYDTADFHLADDIPPDVSKYQVLSYEVLQAIRRDILSTQLPSWLQRPPSNFGSPSHGKLKADQWRTVCTVSMVITLVRLWSSSTASDSDKALLENFLHLVSAVDLASRRSMSRSRAAAYDEHMFRYLSGLQDLFDHQFVPNHHLSLHLHDCLVLFGPVHGWWAFPFERYNGLFHQANTNNKTADIPLTFMRWFYIGANLRQLMETMEWPDSPEYADVMESFREAFGDAMQGTRVVDALPFSTAANSLEEIKYDADQEEILPIPIYTAVLSFLNTVRQRAFTSAYASRPATRNHAPLNPKGQEVGSVLRAKVTYATSSHGARNSFVMYKDRTLCAGGELRAGQISQIYLHGHKISEKMVVEPFFVVKAYQPLNDADALRDPYRRWADINTSLYYNQFEEDVRIVPMDDIVSHFASDVYTPEDIDRECIVVRNLDRVSSASICSCCP
ncbi:hypothetical protein K466DRAFT_500383 [Polyporus arcularius HHB13444]|uniref:DUF4218 domain-containing protein n=1 Tax=Polyporus arcularius HHB13444 TaxID=1314778 RepID=A0A5C3P277_9APHY|nr:hypothetical protein K466DRAFT_500383 [Polyporus arcularius HHB13444]